MSEIDMPTTTIANVPSNTGACNYHSCPPTYPLNREFPLYPTWPTYVQQPATYQFTTPRCAWCQGTHADKCDRQPKSITFRPDGTVERVEFFAPEEEQA